MTEQTEQSHLNSTKNDNINDEKPNHYISQSSRITHLNYRLWKTFFLFLSWIALGLFSEILGPALLSLRVLTSTNYEEISRALSSRAVGLLVGSFVGGILADVFIKHRNFLIFIFLSIAGITIATIPICRSLSALALNLFISGFSHGSFTTSGNPSLGALWMEKSTGPFNFMHAGYGLGAAIAPLLISAFDISNKTMKLNTTISKESHSFIQYPFLIVAAYCISIALVFLIYCFLKNPTDKTEIPFQDHCKGDKTGDDPIVKTDCCFSFRDIRRRIISQITHVKRETVYIIILCFISYFALVGNERVFGKFQFAYAVEGPLNMPRSRGYLINGLYWVSFCIARIFVALVALKVPAKVLLMIEISGALISSMVFTIWNQSEIVFFIFSTTFGFFKSPLFPTMLGVLNLYVTVSGILVVVVNFGSAAGAASFQYLTGYLIEKYGQRAFPLTVTSTSVFLLFVFTFVIVLTRNWKRV